jgi:antitoxin component YwqK of YwqJK toxin-antitoxin module
MILRVHNDDTDCDGDMVLYQGKPFTGIVYELDIDGMVCYEGEHTDGFVSGYSRTWWKPGMLKSEIIYRQKNNPYSRSMQWYANGIVKELKEGLNGTRIRCQKWNEQGILIERWEVLNEDDWDIFVPEASLIANKKRHGTNTEWYDDGSIKEIHSYLKGNLIMHKKYDVCGKLVDTWKINPEKLQ